MILTPNRPRWPLWCWNQGPVSISDKTSYRKISWSIEATRSAVYIIVSLWNLTCTSAAVLPRCLPNFRAIGLFLIQISRHRDFMRSYDKTSYRILKRGPGPRFNKKMTSYQYRKSHSGDKTVVRSSYLHNGISHTGKMSSLYWIGPRIFQINKSLLLLLMPGTILDVQSKSLFPMRRDLNCQIWVSRKCKYIFVTFIQQSGNYSDVQYIGHNSQKDTPLGACKTAFGPDCNDNVIDYEMWTGGVI